MIAQLTSSEIDMVSGGELKTVTEVRIIGGEEVFVRVTYFHEPGTTGWFPIELVEYQ